MKNIIMGLLLAPVILFSSCNEVGPREDKKHVQDYPEQHVAIKKQESKVILFFGNGLTAGYGLKPQQAFPALIQERIDSLGLTFEVLNAGLVEGTSTEGRRQINWMLNEDIDIFVMELGINDHRAGIPFEQTQENIQAIIDTVRSRNPHTTILLAGIENLPSGALSLEKGLRDIYPDLATEYEVALVPCILKNVNGVPGRIQKNSVYPTAEGQQIVARNVWQVLRPLLITDNSITGNY